MILGLLSVNILKSSSDIVLEIIPLEELNQRITDIESKKVPILVISEEGVRSIKACELLVRQGFYSVNNISGGYHYWNSDMPPQL